MGALAEAVASEADLVGDTGVEASAADLAPAALAVPIIIHLIITDLTVTFGAPAGVGVGGADGTTVPAAVPEVWYRW